MTAAEVPASVREPAALRALRAEERSGERTRIADLLRTQAYAAERKAASLSPRPAVTTEGRLAHGLRQALALIERDDIEAGQLWSQVVDQDSVEVYWYDPASDRDPLPVRLVVNDSAELMSAVAYLSLDDAETLGRDILGLVEKLRGERASAEGQGS